MILFKNKYRIESIRLKEYDYSWSGYYFITICTKNRENLFGKIINNKMMLSAFGQLVKRHWQQISKIQNNISLDAFIVMPNHFHGIIIIKHTTVVETIHVEAIHELPLRGRAKRRQMTLSKIIGKFKMNTAKQINKFRNMPGLPVWQCNYYERIVRDETELFRIREYIKNNPINWNGDRNNVNKNI